MKEVLQYVQLFVYFESLFQFLMKLQLMINLLYFTAINYIIHENE